MAKYGFDRLTVGDSLFFPNEPKGTQSNPAVAAHAWARWHGAGWKFATRREGTGVRIWRISPDPKSQSRRAVPKIERGVPVPLVARRLPKRGAPSKYQFDALEVGDSMFFPDAPGGAKSNPAIAARAFAWRQHRAGIKWRVSCRKEDTGVRIWRIA